jgi:hypothetical protein
MLGLAAGVALASLLEVGLLSYEPPSAEKYQSAQFGVSPFFRSMAGEVS